MEEAITYVGLDVHKETISVAVANGGARGEARYYGKIANSEQALRKLAAKLAKGGASASLLLRGRPLWIRHLSHSGGIGA